MVTILSSFSMTVRLPFEQKNILSKKPSREKGPLKLKLTVHVDEWHFSRVTQNI